MTYRLQIYGWGSPKFDPDRVRDLFDTCEQLGLKVDSRLGRINGEGKYLLEAHIVFDNEDDMIQFKLTYL